MVRWIKTAENATDYSIMNTARQLLWLPTTREEKYKAKQAIDTFFVRGGDVLSAVVVYVGSRMLQLTVEQFAIVNIALTLVWIGVALAILGPRRSSSRLAFRPLATAALVLGMVAVAATAFAQETREDERAALQAKKATQLRPYEPTQLERRIERIGSLLNAQKRPVYPFVGSVFSGGGLSLGVGHTRTFGDTGHYDVYAARSFRNFKLVAGDGETADVCRPHPGRPEWELARRAEGGVLSATATSPARNNAPTCSTVRRRSASRRECRRRASSPSAQDSTPSRWKRAFLICRSKLADPSYRRSSVFAEYDWRPSPGYASRGGFYRVELSNYHQTNAGAHSFSRVDAEAQHFVPLRREGSVLAFRALASTTNTAQGESVPFVLLPDLGGSHTLRGYPSWRFRDRNRMALTAEYRWKAGHFVDMALFVDAGQVAPRLADLDLRKFKKTYGLGMSFHTPATTITRIEVARTGEGTALVFSFSPSF